MLYGNTTLRLLLVLQDRRAFDFFCERLQSMGFTVNDAETSKELVKWVGVSSFAVKKISAEKTGDSPSGQLVRMLSHISAKTESIGIILDDLSLMKICQNSHHRSLAYHPTLDEIEKEYIVATLEKCDWRCKTAAKLLGINRSTIYRKIKKYGITQKKKRR